MGSNHPSLDSMAKPRGSATETWMKNLIILSHNYHSDRRRISGDRPSGS
jgi:hypothetical protein